MRNLNNAIEILDADLVKMFPDKLRLIDYWKSALSLPIGWHYDLDIIWILNQIEKLRLPAGSLIMDAGAGNGLLQFILAARGYDILSVDFAKRDIPAAARKIFRISLFTSDAPLGKYHYQEFISHKLFASGTSLGKIEKGLRHPLKAIKYIWRRIRHYTSLFFWIEAIKYKGRYGTITYALADFSELNFLHDASVDCIVSVSAIEHCDHKHIQRAINEFERILKPGSAMVISTSVSGGDDWYFEPCQGWCFSLASLKTIFGLNGCKTNFDDYETLFAKLKKSRIICRRISGCYFESAENGLPWGIYEPQYQPAGIIKYKAENS